MWCCNSRHMFWLVYLCRRHVGGKPILIKYSKGELWVQFSCSILEAFCSRASQIAKFMANMGPTWVLSAPDGPHVGPMNLAIREYHQARKGSALKHDDVIKWKHVLRYWPFVRGIHRSPVNSSHKGQWRGALMFTLICVWINGWVNNREAGDFRRHLAHYDVIVMILGPLLLTWMNYTTRIITPITKCGMKLLF